MGGCQGTTTVAVGFAGPTEIRVGDGEELDMGPDAEAMVEKVAVALFPGPEFLGSSEVEVDEGVERVRLDDAIWPVVSVCSDVALLEV